MTWCAIHAGVLHLAFWATQPLTAGGDTTAFVGAAVALLEQGRIPDGPPGYPAFLALTLAAVEPFGPAVSLVQAGLAVVVAVSIGRLVSHSFGTPAAIAAAVAVTSAGELLDATRALMAESLLCAAIVAATAAANEHARSGRRRDLALFTVATVGATAIRVVPAASLTMLLAGLHAPRWRASTRRWVAAATLATAVAAASWVVISLHVPGGAGLPARAGAHLYNGVVHGKGLIDADGDTTRRFVAALRDRDGGFVPYWRARDRLRAAKLGDGPIDDVLGRIALEAMLADPGALLVKIVGQLGRQLATVPGMARRSLREAAAVADRPLSERAVLPTTARGVGWKSVTDVLSWKVWSWQLAAAAVAVAWAIARRSTAVLAAGWTVVGTLALHATVEDATARYSSMVAPLVRGIGTAAIVGLLHDILRRVLNARQRAR